MQEIAKEGDAGAMNDSARSPRQEADMPQTRAVVDVVAEWLLYASVALILAGILTPSLHKPGLIRGNDMAVRDIVAALWDAQREILAVIIIVFAGVTPLLKTLFAAVLFRMGNRVSHKAAMVMQLLGKWSMLDVFLAALLIGLTQLSAMMAIEPRAGLYLFATGVLLNTLATARLSHAPAP